MNRPASDSIWLLLLFLSSAAAQPPLLGVPGHILALNPEAEHVQILARDLETHLLGAAPGIWIANNGTQAPPLPLYTRLILLAGRHDHFELPTSGSVGCLLSHIAFWRFVLESGAERAMLIEEDARIDETSARRMRQLLNDVKGEPWDILMLETGHITVSGTTRDIGQLGRTWVSPTVQNRWLGIRGYVLTLNGAEILMRHADELDVQADALISLAGMFEGLRIVWTRANIAHPTMWRLSTVQSWDPCIKCYLPSDGRIYLGAVIFCVLVGLICRLRRTPKPSTFMPRIDK